MSTVIIPGRTLMSGSSGAPRRHWKTPTRPDIQPLTFDVSDADPLHDTVQELGADTERLTAALRSLIPDGMSVWTETQAAGLRSGIRRRLLQAGVEPQNVDETVSEIVEVLSEEAGHDLRSPAVVIPEFPEEPEVVGYRMQHRAPADDGYSRPATEILEAFGDPNLLDHPEQSSGMVDAETVAQIRRILADPNAQVTVYRSVPPFVTAIEDGEWISLSRAYAEGHGADFGWPVLQMTVNACQVFTDGNSVNEFGFVAAPKERGARTVM